MNINLLSLEVKKWIYLEKIHPPCLHAKRNMDIKIRPLHDRYHIPNVKKTLTVLEMLAKHPRGMTVAQLMDATGYTKTTVFRVLCTLLDLGYLQKKSDDRTISISRKLVALAYASLSEKNLSEISLDVMREIRDYTGETVMLGVLLESECIMIDQVEGTHFFIFSGKLGMKSPLHASAPGKAILAFVGDEEREKLLSSITLNKITANTFTDRAKLADELKRIRARGYSTDEGEVISGVNCVGAPIFGTNGKFIAVVWVTATSERIRPEKFAEIGAFIKEKAAIISGRMGHGLI